MLKYILISKLCAKLPIFFQLEARYIRNISYFCIVKHFNSKKNNVLTTFFVFVAYFICSNSTHAHQNTANEWADSIHISLLTCQPHPEIYSLYGHTALRYEDRSRNIDIAINYGSFSFEEDFFVLRFVFGLTDYEMAIVPFQYFCKEYSYYGSEVKQQEFNLTREEKLRIAAEIDKNYLPQNRVYRYNFFSDNCTTRARNIVIDNIDGHVVFYNSVPERITMRDMIHEMDADYPWPKLGNDLLMGVAADKVLSRQEIQFLPHSTCSAVDSAYIVNSKGVKRNLLKKSFTVVEGGVQETKKDFPFTPIQCAIVLLFMTTCVSLVEWKKRKYLYLYDIAMFSFQAIIGMALTVMIFSQHPTVSLNIQILAFNPLAVFFGYSAIKNARKQKMHFLWLTNMILISVMLLLYSFEVQWIDPAILLVSLSLLLRSCMKFILIHENKDKKNNQ